MKQEIDLLQFPRVERKLGTRTAKHRAVARRFDKEFFDGARETGYGGYVDDGRWLAVALRMALHYGLVEGISRVLDIGCAKGFLVKAFRDLGIRAYGIDVSEYAIEQSVTPAHTLVADARSVTKWSGRTKFDLVVSINTVHNLEREDLAGVLRSIDAMAPHKYVTVDAWRDAEGRARMEAWNLTAKTMMHADEWKAFFAASRYEGDYYWFTP